MCPNLGQLRLTSATLAIAADLEANPTKFGPICPEPIKAAPDSGNSRPDVGQFQNENLQLRSNDGQYPPKLARLEDLEEVISLQLL